MRLLVLAVILAVMQATPPIPRKAPDQEATQRTKNQQATGTNKQNSRTPSVVAKSPTSPQADTKPEPATKRDAEETISISKLPPVTVQTGPDWWNRTYVVLTGLLVVVGSSGVVYAVKTLKVIRRQGVSMRRQTTQMRRSVMFARRSANAARASALAAKVNADALINSERAWIMVNVSYRSGFTRFKMGENDKRSQIDVKVTCRNAGHAVAWILDKGAVLKLVDKLPEEPDFSDIQIFDPEPECVAPGEYATERTYQTICNGWHAEGDGKLLFFYGRVRYRDSFGDNRETRFGYSINIDNFLERIPGYPEYNKNT